MAKFQIPDTPSFSTIMRKLEVTDPAHADLFNKMFQQLLENDEYNNRMAEEHTYVINPSEGKRYEIGVDEQGVFLQDISPESVIYFLKGLEAEDTIAVSIDHNTYGVENASNGTTEVPEGGSVFSIIK